MTLFVAVTAGVAIRSMLVSGELFIDSKLLRFIESFVLSWARRFFAPLQEEEWESHFGRKNLSSA